MSSLFFVSRRNPRRRKHQERRTLRERGSHCTELGESLSTILQRKRKFGTGGLNDDADNERGRWGSEGINERRCPECPVY